ncbi:BZ3500_MvSof-1268-A1-R1_Chr1-2g01377 [Microbotryum saponariae]|uniref:BZ3500_MvSof-1268-A1-R1_Chr1-2g01377 protein n=1 Tax=Microbotryum saponariae TaxID=289078 RepID=A0A2X0MS92_9BASI|nr:BZ3500_MvSof-1268-A1-R1_Chr1-2g01377 [Microbotryum saponariae]SCZ97250.1 BZ3501_MvSof-1269-A2-R1_Chr1-2g00976 [Microbotryum saponariae]
MTGSQELEVKEQANDGPDATPSKSLEKRSLDMGSASGEDSEDRHSADEKELKHKTLQQLVDEVR